MPYCFLNHRPAADDHDADPDCPEGVAFVLLADLPGLEWGIYEVEEHHGWSPETAVSDDLTNLIESAKRYPPALALAREEMVDVYGDGHPGQSDFARAYGTALQTHLAKQYEAPHVLARALRGQAGYLTEGEWYWVLEISGSPVLAAWVSADFHIYNSDIGEFDLTGEQLKRLGFSA